MDLDLGKLFEQNRFGELEIVLNKCEQAVTEIDLILWTWQTDLDMMSFIGQEIPMKVYVPDPPVNDFMNDFMLPMPVKRVPLVKYAGNKRVVFGIVDVHKHLGVIKAEVNDRDAELLAIPGPAAYSIVDEVPPVLDKPKIRAELRKLIGRRMYKNQYALKPEVKE